MVLFCNQYLNAMKQNQYERKIETISSKLALKHDTNKL